MGKKRIPIEEIKERLFNKHGHLVSIKETTFISTHKRATFIDCDFGEWIAIVKSVLSGNRHPKRWAKKRSFSEEIVNRKISEIHGDTVKLKSKTFTTAKNKAIFIDKDFGEWECIAVLVWRGSGHPKRADLNHRSTLKEVKDKIFNIHENTIKIVDGSYVKVAAKAKFVDIEYGEFECLVNSVLQGVGHPARKKEKSEKTCLERYGVKHASQNLEIALKAAKGCAKRSFRNHWKTNEELVCIAGWEPKVVDYLNANKIDFLWQPQIFKMPNGKTYRPDLYLVGEDKWVEIKGLFRLDSKIKWNWFLTQFPNAELWDQKKLKEMKIL